MNKLKMKLFVIEHYNGYLYTQCNDNQLLLVLVNVYRKILHFGTYTFFSVVIYSLKWSKIIVEVSMYTQHGLQFNVS